MVDKNKAPFKGPRIPGMTRTQSRLAGIGRALAINAEKTRRYQKGRGCRRRPIVVDGKIADLLHLQVQLLREE